MGAGHDSAWRKVESGGRGEGTQFGGARVTGCGGAALTGARGGPSGREAQTLAAYRPRLPADIGAAPSGELGRNALQRGNGRSARRMVEAVSVLPGVEGGVDGGSADRDADIRTQDGAHSFQS